MPRREVRVGTSWSVSEVDGRGWQALEARGDQLRWRREEGHVTYREWAESVDWDVTWSARKNEREEDMVRYRKSRASSLSPETVELSAIP